MDLILWRHAEAHPAEPGQSDLDRCLTDEGRRQAERMAAWLSRRCPAATLWVSPAERTRQTAEPWSLPKHVAPLLAPNALAPNVHQAVMASQVQGEPLVLVGHQPTLGQLAALWMCGQVQSWSVEKGAIWWLRCHNAGAEAERDGRRALWALHAMRTPDEV